MHPPTPLERVLLVAEKFQVVQLVFPDQPDRAARHVIRHPGSVAILPLVDHHTLCLIRNRRAAVGADLLELPAGTLGPGEQPEAAARRELAEETGYEAGRLELMARFYVSPGVLDEQMWLYLAADLTPGPQRLEPDEQIQPVRISWSEAQTLLDQGRIDDAKTLIGLLLYERSRLARPRA